MGRTRAQTVGRREGGSFIAVPRAILEHRNYIALSAHAVKLFYDLYAQYRGNNNGDLCAAWKLMAARGWKSRDTLTKARAELLERGWIVVSRQGGRRIPTLYALTFMAIDECGGKLDISPTRTPPGHWKTNSLARPACHLSTPGVSMEGLTNEH